MFLQKTGTQLVTKALSSFNEVITALDTGIQACNVEAEAIDKELVELKGRLKDSQGSKQQAEQIKHNIEKMLGLKG